MSTHRNGLCSSHQSGRISGLSSIASAYRAVFCDVWGVLHNGQSVYADAADALAHYRASGGRVVLLTNSPRPHDGVREQLDGLGVARDVYDAIVTSGDVTRDLIASAEGQVFHLGPPRDLPLFEGIDVERVGENECTTIVCTGLFDDENETPEYYRERLLPLAAREVPLICANPDIVVERGDRLVWCAGSLARLYEELGGQIRIAGKPHKPIYDLALKTLNELTATEPSSSPERESGKDGIIAIGDGMPTDVAGAQDNGFDLLYISGGIHHKEYGTPENPDEDRLADFLRLHGATPNVWMPRLVWEGA